jgi:hypothetical protein
VLALAAALSALAGPVDCDRFGEVSPDEARIAFGGEPVTFEVVGAGACGEADGCTWRVDGDLGAIQPASGSPVRYTPPPAPSDCIDTSAQLRVKCAGTAGYAVLTLACSRDAPTPDEDPQPGGGGCGSPGWALALLPLALAIRRQAPVRR